MVNVFCNVYPLCEVYAACMTDLAFTCMYIPCSWIRGLREWPKFTGKSPGQPGGGASRFFTTVVGGAMTFFEMTNGGANTFFGIYFLGKILF